MDSASTENLPGNCIVTNVTNTLIKMADAAASNVALSNFLLNSFSSIEGNTCKRCDESEIQLNEALSELSSAQMIINILQKELILAKTSTSIDPDIRLHNEPDTEAWKPITYNNS